MQTKSGFRRRILLVDSDTRFLKSSSDMLRKRRYEVVTAKDGFEALVALRGGHPDVLITELNLPRLSGFELLSIIRTRFPQIAVLSISDEYTPVTVPHEAICDAFLPKGANFEFELFEEIQNLIHASPIRGSRPKSNLAPVWIPRSGRGYIILTCPECLRSFSAVEAKVGMAHEICLCCGADVPFEMSEVEVLPSPAPPSVQHRSRKARGKSRQLRGEGQRLRDNIPPKL
jgi:CheY-like chemotaxis protein